MKRCPSCGESYGDGVKFCDGDGTPLVAESAPAEGRRAPWGALGVGLALGVAVCVAALVLYRVASRDDERAVATPRPSTDVRGAPTPPARPTAAEPAPTPSPEATPSPSPSLAPTQPPPRREEDGLDALSDSPAKTGGPGARAEARVIFHLTDGGTVEAEDAWRAPGGAWYRRGGVLEWLDRSRIRSVERPAAPTPAPPAPQGSPR